MTFNSVIEICLSLILIYALFSILVSLLNEWMAQIYDRRTRLLQEALRKVLNDPFNLNYAELFFRHYAIRTLTFYRASPAQQLLHFFGARTSGKASGPQYIPAPLFAAVFVDLISSQYQHQQIAEPEKDENGFAKLDAEGKKIYSAFEVPAEVPLNDRFSIALKRQKPSPFMDMITALYERAEQNQEKFQILLSEWFDDYMNRVSGWYKNKQRAHLFWIGLAIAISLNIDSLHLLKTLSIDEELRSDLATSAQMLAHNYESLTDSLKRTATAELEAFKRVVQQGKQDTLQSRPTESSDSLLQNRLTQVQAILLQSDSTTKEYITKKNEILRLSMALRLPIGYDASRAPLSWFHEGDRPVRLDPKLNDNPLLQYEYNRNSGTDFTYILRYVLGIFITAVSLSFGAPFWFDLLLKFVNVRRAGPKPQTIKSPN